MQAGRVRPGGRRRLIGTIDRWDPVALIIAAHGMGLALAGETESPVLIALLVGSLAIARVVVVWLAPQTTGIWRLAISGVSIVVAYVVIVADGGTESPFFFWILLLLAWQVLIYNRSRFILLGGFTVVAYLVTVLLTGELTVTSMARLGLLAAFVVALAIGRALQDHQISDLARLDEMVSTVVADTPMAVAIFDSDRDTLLYANQAANDMGISDLDSMGLLVLTEQSNSPRLTTLAAQVMGAGFESSPPRSYRPIGKTIPEYRIGFHARRGAGSPMIMVYGVTMESSAGILENRPDDPSTTPAGENHDPGIGPGGLTGPDEDEPSSGSSLAF